MGLWDSNRLQSFLHLPLQDQLRQMDLPLKSLGRAHDQCPSPVNLAVIWGVRV